MLVIIGLLIGGVFVGQSLIHNAQINAVITEFNRYQTAVQSFNQLYNGLPGDLKNATSIWGVAGGTGSDSTCATTVSTTAATCNGNGDGVIMTSVTGYDETFLFWKHLANAKIVEGSYPGNAMPASPVVGVNVPVSKYGSAVGWFVVPGYVYGGGSATAFNSDYGGGHMLQFSNAGAAGITPKDAWSIDKKIDDGKPGMGNVILYNWPSCTNAANKNDMAAIYALNATAPSCLLFFIVNF